MYEGIGFSIASYYIENSIRLAQLVLLSEVHLIMPNNRLVNLADKVGVYVK